MLEFLLEPGAIALLATGGGAVALKFIEKSLSKDKNNYQNTTIDQDIFKAEPVKIEIPDAEKCIYFGHRQLEWMTAQNGDFDMADGLTCMERHCPNCAQIKEMFRVRQTNATLAEDGRKALPMPEYKHIHPKKVKATPTPPKGEGGGSKKYSLTHEREDRKPSEDAPDFQQFQWLKRNDPRYKGYTFKDYEFQQNLRRANAKREADARARTQRYDEIHKSHLNKRVSVVDGMEVPIPKNVPSFADAKLVYDPVQLADFILWTWKYDDTKKFSFRQNINREEFESYAMDGTKVGSWETIIDPTNGDVLGSYNKNSKDLSNDPADVAAAKDFLNKMKELSKDIEKMQEKVG